MGTNYYANWKLSSQNSDAPFSLNRPAVSLDFHICKSLTNFQGAVFNSWSAWSNFLLNERDRITITDEYGVEYEVGAFIGHVETTKTESRSRQYRWMVDHFPADQRKDDWLDPDGFSFHRGEFC
jgi:hypothetical protein